MKVKVKLLKNKTQLFLILVFLSLVGWWFSFQSVVTAQGHSVQWFGGTYGIVALFGALIGLSASRKWGGYKTMLGRSLLFFALGLLAQEAGQLIYTYYTYGAKIQIPYPSWGDVAYFGSVLLYIYATWLLAKITGAKFSLKNTRYKLVALLIPAALLITSYSVLLHNHKYDYSKPVTVFLDFGYPMGQAIYIAIAITAYLLSRKMLGGVMKSGILLIILALFIQYVSDSTFIYQSSRGTFLAGRYDDLFYLIAYFAMGIAMIKFHSIYAGLRAKPNKVPDEVTKL